MHIHPSMYRWLQLYIIINLRFCTAAYLNDLHIKSTASSRALLGLLFFQNYFHLIVVILLGTEVFWQKWNVELVRVLGESVDIDMPFPIEKDKSVHSINLYKCKREYTSSSSSIITLTSNFSVKISLNLLSVKWDKNQLASKTQHYLELSKLLKIKQQNLHWFIRAFLPPGWTIPLLTRPNQMTIP